MKVLCVAEKPSIAKAVSQILGGGRVDITGTANKYIKNYKFSSRLPEWGECDVVFTSVSGHLMEADFDVQWRKWNQCAPVTLFEEARIVETIPQVLSHAGVCVDDRDQKGFMIILCGRVDRLEGCLFGRIVIGKENILELKLKKLRRKETHKSW